MDEVEHWHRRVAAREDIAAVIQKWAERFPLDDRFGLTLRQQAAVIGDIPPPPREVAEAVEAGRRTPLSLVDAEEGC